MSENNVNRRTSILRPNMNMDETANFMDSIPANKRQSTKTRRVSFSRQKTIQEFYKNDLGFCDEPQSEIMHLSNSGSHEQLRGLSMISNENRAPEANYSELELTASKGLVMMKGQEPKSSTGDDTARVFNNTLPKNNISISAYNSTLNGSDENTLDIFQKQKPPAQDCSLYSEKTAILFNNDIQAKPRQECTYSNIPLNSTVEDTEMLWSPQLKKSQTFEPESQNNINQQEQGRCTPSRLDNDSAASLQSIERTRVISRLDGVNVNATKNIFDSSSDHSLSKSRLPDFSFQLCSRLMDASAGDVDLTLRGNTPQITKDIEIDSTQQAETMEEDTTQSSNSILPDKTLTIVPQLDDHEPQPQDISTDDKVNQSEILEDATQMDATYNVNQSHDINHTHELVTINMSLSQALKEDPEGVLEEIVKVEKPEEPGKTVGSLQFTEPLMVRKSTTLRPPATSINVNETPKVSAKPLDRHRYSMVTPSVSATPQNMFSFATPLTTPRPCAPSIPTFQIDNPYLHVPEFLRDYDTSVRPITESLSCAPKFNLEFNLDNVDPSTIDGQTRLICCKILQETNGDHEFAINLVKKKYQDSLDQIKPEVEKMESLKQKYLAKADEFKQKSHIHTQLIHKALAKRETLQSHIQAQQDHVKLLFTKCRKH